MTKKEEKETFNGKASGMTFEKFDDMVISWGRKRFGDKYAQKLWKNELVDLMSLDLTDELDKFNFDMHCNQVYDVLASESVKYADSLFETERFWTRKWQIENRSRQREKMYCYLEELCAGEAARQLRKRGVDQMDTMRDFFFKRFGAGQPDVIQERVRLYLLGMPDPKTKLAFPPRCNMEDKLDRLEQEREYLLDMCPKDKRENYEDGKESTLVKIILRTIPAEYDQSVKSVRDLTRVRKYGESGDLTTISNAEDNTRINYSDEWVPPYTELRTELISAWRLMERRRNEKSGTSSSSAGHPVLPILEGHIQPGPGKKNCFGCGEEGHYRGDSACKAGPNDVWSGAPKSYKEKVQKLKPKGVKSSNNKNPHLRNSSKKKEHNDGICHNWSRGNGFCKWGDNCRFKHEGPKGGNKKRKATLVASSGKKKQKERKKLASLILKDLRKMIGKDNEDKYEDNEHLYSLVRGQPTVLLLNERSEDNYVPKRNGEKSKKVVKGKSKGNGKLSPTQFLLSLMMSTDSDDSSVEYVPNRPFGNGKEAGEVPEKKENDVEKFESHEKFDLTQERDVENVNSKIEKQNKKRTFLINDNKKLIVNLVKENPDKRGFEPKVGDSVQSVDSEEGVESSSEEITGKEKSKKNKNVFKDEQEVISTFVTQEKMFKTRAAANKRHNESSSAVDTEPRRAHDPNKFKRILSDCPESLRRHRKKFTNERDWAKPENLNEIQKETYSAEDTYVLLRIPKSGEGRYTHFEIDYNFEPRPDNCMNFEGPYKQEKSVKEILAIQRKRDFPWRTEFGGTRPNATKHQKRYGRKVLQGKAAAKRKADDIVKSEVDTQLYAAETSIPFIRFNIGDRVYVEDRTEDKKVLKGKLEKVCQKEGAVTGWIEPGQLDNDGNSIIYKIKFDGEDDVTKVSEDHVRAGSWDVKPDPKSEAEPSAIDDKNKTDELPQFEVGDLVLLSKDFMSDLSTAISYSGVPMQQYMGVVQGWTQTSYGGLIYSVSFLQDLGKQIDLHPSDIELIPDDIPEDKSKKKMKVCLMGRKACTLHSMSRIGIDTCSALSVSTEVSDFMFIDESTAARDSVSIRGVGGADAIVLGRGPLVVATRDRNGNKIFMVDPAGVYLKSSGKQARLRIFGQQRMKRFGFDLQQNKYKNGQDFLSYKGSLDIPLETENEILMLPTEDKKLSETESKKIDSFISQLLVEDQPKSDFYCFKLDQEKQILPVLFGGLNNVEKVRLEHWRNAHRDKPGQKLLEDCPTCNKAKHKKKPHKKNVIFHGTSSKTILPFWRLYNDGYGGQLSMGCESIQGAKGGYVFVCPVAGKIIPKLYASTDQYPAALYQVLQKIESEGFVNREIYVDTHSVNLSKAAEEVAQMFKTRIIPISAGTPQELAYAERAVGTLGQMSRALMIGAPHLPQFCWGLSDLYAAHVHQTCVQPARNFKSPYEIIYGRKPDPDLLFIHVFGCPCQYSPMSGPEHKRADKTLWGFFVGVQGMMVLILRPEDNKVLSISPKKVTCHEQMYAKFDPTKQQRPLIHFTDFRLNPDEIDEAVARAKQEDDDLIADRVKSIPNHVQSIKSLSDYKRNDNLNKCQPKNMPTSMEIFNSPEPDDRGENNDLNTIKEPYDHLLQEIELTKEKTKLDKDTKTIQIRKALAKVEEEIRNDGPRRNTLKQKIKSVPGMETKNILSSKRNKINRSPEKQPKVRKTKKSDKNKCFFNTGDYVAIETERFGKEYAKGKPRMTYGIVQSAKKKIVSVLWEGTEDGKVMKSHEQHLLKVDKNQFNPVAKIPVDEVESVLVIKGKLVPRRSTIKTILPVLEVGAALAKENDDSSGNWPKDFYQALIRDDWRDWVQAVKNENDSWNQFNAAEEVPYEEMEVGASIIPLGELYTIKRSGKYKFRQYAMGNLLKSGKDYGETFSSTVSGDGLRWFCSLAASCGREIRGWDATTGYLQTEQRVPVYAYLPSHHGFSDLSFEKLGEFRLQMVRRYKEEGVKGIISFSKEMKKERRNKPKTVLKLNKSVYGIPDAGQSFSMYMQSLHIKRAGLMQSDMDPCIYYKILEDAPGGLVIEFIVVITWVDDCRYFGTKKYVKEYEETIQKHCKCTLEGVSKEFVSIEIEHDLQAKTLELKQEEYWCKAIERFKEFFVNGKVNPRRCPLSPADEKLLVEPTEQEMESAKHLPYPNLLGVVQYPSSYTKLEMRYSMSVLSRHRTKWGRNHFTILLKALEYGYSTRKTGLMYNGLGRKEEQNILIGYADSSFTLPRSQGCHLVLMNGAPISFSSKRHTLTDDSTASAELQEQYLCACDLEGFRNLMEEIGLKQQGPSTIFQDNKSAIQIAMNRGSLSKKSRAMGIKVLTIRNKIEDMKVVPIYVETGRMVADIGTKALDPKQFELLKDMLCGYAVVGMLKEGKTKEYLSAICKEVDKKSARPSISTCSKKRRVRTQEDQKEEMKTLDKEQQRRKYKRPRMNTRNTWW